MRRLILTIIIILPLFGEGDASIPCTVSCVKERVINRKFTGYGMVKPYKTYTYWSPVNGFVRYFPFGEGDFVERGAMIIKVVDSSIIYEKISLEKELKMLEAVAKTGVLEADYYRKKSRLMKLFKKISLMNFRAPFDGIITGVKVVEGEYVLEGSELFSIVFRDTFVVEVSFPPVELSQIQPGYMAELEFQSGRTLISRVASRKISDKNPSILIKVPYFKELVPGEFVRVTVFKPLKKSVAIPVEALISDENGRFHVFKIQNGMARWVYVKPGVMGDDFVEILEGDLSPGDTVAVSGNLYLGHNVKVKIIKCIE